MCTREELEAHFQAAKEFRQMRGEITSLRKRGLDADKAYTQVVRNHDNPLLLRYYASSLYTHAMTVPLEPVEREETVPARQYPLLEPQEQAPAIQPAQKPENVPVEKQEQGLREEPTKVMRGYILVLPGGGILYLSLEEFTALLESIAQEFLAIENAA